MSRESSANRRVNPTKRRNSESGRWRAMDADQDQSDDQVGSCEHAWAGTGEEEYLRVKESVGARAAWGTVSRAPIGFFAHTQRLPLRSKTSRAAAT